MPICIELCDFVLFPINASKTDSGKQALAKQNKQKKQNRKDNEKKKKKKKKKNHPFCLVSRASNENQGAVLTQVRDLGTQGIFFPESAFSADSLTVSVQPPCQFSRVLQHLCAR